MSDVMLNGSAAAIGRRVKAIVFNSAALVLGSGLASAATFYVATNGSDSAPGTISQPLKTINTAAGKLTGGDTLYLRGGIYTQMVYVAKSGTVDSPILISGYPGEDAVIDGRHVIPANDYGVLFKVAGNHVSVSNLTVCRSWWLGLSVGGQYNEAVAVSSWGNMNNGIVVGGIGNHRVHGCNVYSNSMCSAQYVLTRGGWSGGLNIARGGSGSVVYDNLVWNNWGEGLSCFESYSNTIVGNVSFNSRTCFYLSDSKYCRVERNLFYATPGNAFDPGGRAQTGILIGDEKYRPASSDNIICNNLVLGCSISLYFLAGVQQITQTNVLIAHNTLVNATGDYNVAFNPTNYVNVEFKNNIIVQEDTTSIGRLVTTRGFTASHNLWSKTPPTALRGTGDVVGDPLLAKVGPVGAGELSPNWFQLLAGSPARGAGVAVPGVPADFFGVTRATPPDIGACSFQLPSRPGSPSGLTVSEY